tara:strand:- start:652 stop:840 length:189 start_codon:yes stop_codon:yes gene_type:complete
MENKTIKHEIKLQKSVIIILGIFAVGIFLNAFAPSLNIKSALALGNYDTINVNHSGYINVNN